MRAATLLALALLACAAARTASQAGCAVGCHLHGTCHAPLGRCDCPRYFAGADCSRRATPSCMVDAASGLDSGCRLVSTCACVLECEAAGFRPLEQGECYNYSAAEPSFDAMLRAPLLEFGTLDRAATGVQNSDMEFRRGAWTAVDVQRNGWRLLPLSDCRDSCNHAGYCRRSARLGGIPECICLEDRNGLQGACEADAGFTLHCLGNCSGRGRCLRGFCHCEQGAYGADCSLTGDAAEQLFWHADGSALPAEDAVLRPRVYVYTLPPRLNTWYGISQVSPSRDFGTLLHERLLSSRYRTANPEEADFFFVPVSPMGQVNHYTSVRAAEWVAAQYPYWARKRGADHIYAFPWDYGACWVGGHPMLNNSVFVTHFGLNARLGEYACDCPACAPSFTAGKDVVVPDALNHIDPKRELAAARALRAKKRRAEPERTTLLFFSGGRTGPARVALFDAALSGPGVRVLETEDDIAVEMATAVFCISAPGSGFGSRFALAVMAGCIPVSYVDAVREPFEGVVDLEAISMRIPQAALPDLVAILRNVSAADVAAKQKQLACVRPHFLWSGAIGSLEGEDGGADAFEALMYALRVRVTPGPHPLLSCATTGVPGAPKPLRKPCALDECATEGPWPPGGAACGAANERPC